MALQTLCFGAKLHLSLYFRIYISTVPCPLSTTYATIPVGAVAYSGSRTLKFGRSVDGYLNYFRCRGSELHLLRCTQSVGTCNRDYIAGVHCYGDVVPGLGLQCPDFHSVPSITRSMYTDLQKKGKV